MNNILPLISLHYFPCLEYFIILSQASKIKIEAYENYEKQSYRNRCYILGANNIQMLSVPVLSGNSKGLMRDIRIDYSQNWVNVHWRSISSAYGKSPFFMYYGDFFKEILFERKKFLFDLNLKLIEKIVQILGVNIEISFTSQYNLEPEADELDLRSSISPQNSYQLNGIYSPCRYNQIFGSEFVTNLSILDLLLCEGSDALRILKKSTAFHLNEEKKG